MGSFTVFNSINMCIRTHFLFLPFIGWLGASLRIVQHRLLINWQRYLSKCFFMKECRGDRSIEISQRKQQSERERERFITPPNPHLQVYNYTDVYFTGVHYTNVHYTGVYFTCVYYTGVYYTSINYKKWTGRSLDHRSAKTHLFSSKGHNSGHSSCVLFFL